MSLVGHVQTLWRYPVSSLRGETLASASIGADGIESDRILGMVDAADGSVASPDNQKRWRVSPELQSRMGAGGVMVSADGQVWHAVESDAARQAASDRVGFPVEFRRFGDADVCDATKPRYDRAPLHILTTASMRALANAVPLPDEIDARRFRPNIVIETEVGFEGFVEHEWVGRTLTIGAIEVRVREPCARCSFVALGQAELSFQPPVLHAISQRGGGFGILAEVTVPGTVDAGAAVRLI